MKLIIAVIAASGVVAKPRGRNPMNHLTSVFDAAEGFIESFKKDYPSINRPNRVAQYEKTKERLERIWRK